MFKKIMKEDIEYPDNFSDTVKDLLQGLLNRNP